MLPPAHDASREGMREGVPMRVIIEPGGEGTITSFPLP